MDNKINTNDHSDASVFDVHTMKKDNELRLKSAEQDLSFSDNEKNTQTNKNDLANPFLTQNDPLTPLADTTPVSKSNRSIERLNQSTKDIATNAIQIPQKTFSEPPKKNKSLLLIMIVFVSVFLVGIIIFIGYILTNKKSDTPNVKEPTSDVLTTDTTATDTKSPDMTTDQTYALDLPNYISFDVESPTAKNEIRDELKTIVKAVAQQDPQKPVSFIITDINNNPVSFHVFALSSGMNVSQEILSSLEENFELYAYNDPANGVRFGLVIDAKNITSLQEALKKNELSLTDSLSLFLNEVLIDKKNLLFKDSAYNTHPIRYVNLDPLESYSIDYTIHEQKLILGTTKNTLRAIIDSMKTIAPSKTSTDGFSY